MSERDIELQDQENWEIGEAVVRPGVKKPRAVVSVAFSRDEFNQVVLAAELSEVRTSEFIRQAALDQASTLAKVTDFQLGGATMNNVMFVHGRVSTGTSTYSKPDVNVGSVVD